jgi:hypothetical protein
MPQVEDEFPKAQLPIAEPRAASLFQPGAQLRVGQVSL